MAQELKSILFPNITATLKHYIVRHTGNIRSYRARSTLTGGFSQPCQAKKGSQQSLWSH